MKLRKLIYFIYISVFVFALLGRVDAKNYEATATVSLAKSSAINPNETLLDVNNQTVWIRQDGYFHWSDHFSGLNGTFPKGTSGTVFSQGVVWGGKVNDGNNPVVRVNGSTYNNGMQAGKVLVDANGKATGADSPDNYHVWRVHRNWETMNLVTPASQFFGKAEGQVTDADIAEIREQYRSDWVNWPADRGAPYEDVNNDGNYDPNVDIPGYPGADQTLWIVANDLSPGISESVYGSPSIGLEMQQTLWGYNFPASSPLGNIAFLRTRLIYTGTPDGTDDATIDSMYVSHWVDPDVGDAGDDYAGSDTTLSLGYAYNGNATDATYLNNFGLAAPATGWDFLQGPIVDDGSGPDTLGLSAFTYFAAGSTIGDPDLGDYNGSLQFYNLMRGFLPRPEYPEGKPWVSPTGDTTKFVLSGDPVAGTGWIDGIDLSPGDRRIVLATGPFTMAIGDTQDIVVGQVSALGSDNLGSVTLLKNYDILAQRAYDQDFQLVTPPSVPTVESEPLDEKIVINWGNNVSEVQQVENLYSRGFAFEGYNVYQLPSASASIADGVKIATYDKANGVTTLKGLAVDPATGVPDSIITQNGTDSGLKRFIEITEDKIRNRPLSNGVEYYFAIQAYSYLQNPADNVFGIPSQSLESPPFIVTTTPQPVKPSVEYSSAQGDTVEVQHPEGVSNGSVYPIVVDPSLTTGDVYAVLFEQSASAPSGV
ncbi:MAG: hypothetical protein GF372_11325, partial [Candidatus Marinimicrobia bacterium]|nr:hypothetical protein [Candidatus Neomarinimicrobiota bacterium]